MLIVLCAGMALAYLVRSHTVPAIGLPGLVLVVLAALACLSAVPIVSALLLLLIAGLLVVPHIRRPAVAMPLLLASLAALVAALGAEPCAAFFAMTTQRLAGPRFAGLLVYTAYSGHSCATAGDQ